MRRSQVVGAVTFALAFVALLLALGLAPGTDLSIRYVGDRVVLRSSTGSDVDLPMATSARPGLMSTSHVEDMENMKSRRQSPDDVVVSGRLVEGQSLTLTTAAGATITIPVVRPAATVYTVYWARIAATGTPATYASTMAAGGPDVQTATTTALVSGTHRATLQGFTASGNGYSLCAYPVALGGQWVAYTGLGGGGPCGAGSSGMDEGTAEIGGVEYRFWRTRNVLTAFWFDIAFTLFFDPPI